MIRSLLGRLDKLIPADAEAHAQWAALYRAVDPAQLLRRDVQWRCFSDERIQATVARIPSG